MIEIGLIAASLILWMAFIIFAELKTKLWPKVEGSFWEMPVHLMSVILWVISVLYNFTYGALLFLDLPPMQKPYIKHLTFTSRMHHYMAYNQGWRRDLTLWIYRNMVYKFDPDH